ncbi:hypothetical protein EDB83DRAFT_2537547 [Lactarius deliciosus]|nr:hypothetical protein EDB83DRAFT_2537547 [Lactarius deliciosus]
MSSPRPSHNPHDVPAVLDVLATSPYPDNGSHPLSTLPRRERLVEPHRHRIGSLYESPPYQDYVRLPRMWWRRKDDHGDDDDDMKTITAAATTAKTIKTAAATRKRLQRRQRRHEDDQDGSGDGAKTIKTTTATTTTRWRRQRRKDDHGDDDDDDDDDDDMKTITATEAIKTVVFSQYIQVVQSSNKMLMDVGKQVAFAQAPAPAATCVAAAVRQKHVWSRSSVHQETLRADPTDDDDDEWAATEGTRPPARPRSPSATGPPIATCTHDDDDTGCDGHSAPAPVSRAPPMAMVTATGTSPQHRPLALAQSPATCTPYDDDEGDTESPTPLQLPRTVRPYDDNSYGGSDGGKGYNNAAATARDCAHPCDDGNGSDATPLPLPQTPTR